MASSAGVKRSAFLVTYWELGNHIVYNYQTHSATVCSPLEQAILSSASHWSDPGELAARVAGPGTEPTAVRQAIEALVERGVLEVASRPPDGAERALAAWKGWNPAAGFFHSVSKNPPPVHPEAATLRAERIVVERGYPAMLKRYPGSTLELPASDFEPAFAEILGQRRTWREFGGRSLSLNELSSLLGSTFGVVRWLEADAGKWVALKTSPSGGARHTIEAYVLVFQVDGIANGTYHYCPDAHALTLLRSPTPRELLADFVPAQTGYHDPAIFVVMTAIFERMQWKYEHPRAYRVVMLDAGHLGQTFALTATALGLAPFCTAALDDASIESHLGIDGTSESVVFAVGAGARPSGKDWAPSHHESPLPRTAPPSWASRLSGRAFP